MSFDIVPHLIECASRGEQARLSALKGSGDLDRRGFRDCTALMSVAHTGDVEAVQVLLAAGADPNILNHTGRSALMYAAYGCHTEVVRTLVAGGAQPNLCDRRGRTALDYCLLNPEKNSACQTALRTVGAHLGASAPRGLRRAVGNAIAGDQFSDCQHRIDFWIGLVVGGFCYWFALIGLVVVAAASALGPLWSAVSGALYAVAFVLLIARLVVPLFPAVIRLAIRLARAQSPVGREPATENVDVRSPEFFCAILEQGQGEFGKWRRRNLAGGVLADESLDWPLLLSAGIVALSLLGLVLLPLELFQVAISGGRVDLYAILSSSVSVGGVRIYSAWHIALVLVALWILETYLRGVRLQLAQRRVDGLAADLNWLLDQSSYAGTRPHGPFAVYLRPFYSTNRLHVGGSDLETLLAYSFLPHVPIIALGKPGEHVGAGRVQTSDTEWRDDITRLVDASEMILCIPSATEGTLWELALLAQRNLLDKTLFMMPPATGQMDYAREWERVRASPIQDTLSFPPYVPEGLVFRVRHGTGVEVFTPLRLEQFTLQAIYQGGGSSNSDDASEHSSENGADAAGDNAAGGAVGAPSFGAIGAAGFVANADLAIDQSFELLAAETEGGDGSESGDGAGSDGGDSGS